MPLHAVCDIGELVISGGQTDDMTRKSKKFDLRVQRRVTQDLGISVLIGTPVLPGFGLIGPKSPGSGG